MGGSRSSSLQRVCVFCGSSPGADPRFMAAAKEVGSTLATHGIELVYGGANVGLMGALADSAMAAGGKVIGVMPRHLVGFEVAHTGLADLRIVDSMHERKALMAELSDAFIALPGGFGTLEETFEIVTWRQLGLHAKPVGLLNVAGYFDSLVSFLDRMVDERLLSPENRALLEVSESVGQLLDAFARVPPPGGQKWLDRDKT